MTLLRWPRQHRKCIIFASCWIEILRICQTTGATKIRAILWENLILHVPKLCSLFDRFQNCFRFSSMAFPSNVGTFSQRLLVLHACKQTKQIHLCWLWSSQKQPESQIQAEVVPKPKQAVDVGHRAAKTLVNLQTSLRFLDSTLWSSTWPSRLHVGPVAVLRYNYLLTTTEQFCFLRKKYPPNIHISGLYLNGRTPHRGLFDGHFHCYISRWVFHKDLSAPLDQKIRSNLLPRKSFSSCHLRLQHWAAHVIHQQSTTLKQWVTDFPAVVFHISRWYLS